MWRFQWKGFLISFILGFSSRKIRRENPINRIQRIQEFLDDFKTKEPFLQNICSGVYDLYQKELQKEYLKVSHHPFPDEYLDLDEHEFKQNNSFDYIIYEEAIKYSL